ncbi:zinc finger protein 569 isoform X4 [Spodoptera frugiperda]|uniref:Zinc finger protein 569 isoform X4 n=1 Tax=Spodoptera frugiperda TaxID=7108 RepID=A0A9R0E551_SPOFR|nr:zinc finger protein 569 isoform X4 [Spodoptera frugiperda]
MDPKTTDWRAGPNVCRCCLAEGCYKDISTEYFWMGKREVYAEMLSETLNLSIAYSNSGGPNSNSRLICELCISRLRDASDFKRQVQECERTFLRHLDPGSSSMAGDVEVTLEPTEVDPDVKLERVKQEKPVSDDDDEFDERCGFDDDDDDDDLDDQPLTRLASRIPKKESVDLLDLLDNTKATEKRKSSSKAKSVPTKKAKTIKKDVKATSSKTPVKTEKKKKGSETAFPEMRRRIVPLFQVAYDRSLCRPLGTLIDFNRIRKNTVRSLSPPRDFSPERSPSPVSLANEPSPFIPNAQSIPVQEKTVAKKNPDVRQNALAVFEFSTVYPFVYSSNKFKCFVCSQPFLELKDLKVHMSATHNYAPLKRLVNNRRENILKVDVSDLLCKICLERPANLVELKRHLKEVHNKPLNLDIQDNMIPFKLELDEDGYKCVICERNFIKVRVLVIHMSEHFNNYSCEICGSVFMTLRLLKKHLEVHDSGNYPCDRCNKVFSTPYKRTLHIRGVHLKQCPRRCPMCPEKFNSNYKRAIHLQDVHNQETKVHKCKTCGRAFNLKYHLVCHVRSVHLQERNHQCDVCHQRFCNKESLKRHMVIHTGEKNHKCDVCGMAFLRRKNLKDHLRLHDIS